MSLKTKAILSRLLKGFISGALTTIGMIAIFIPSDFAQLTILLKTLLFAGIAGGLNGFFLAAQKWISWKDEI